MPAAIQDLVDALVSKGSLTVDVVHSEMRQQLADLGFVYSSDRAQIEVPTDVELLGRDAIVNGLQPETREWLKQLDILACVDSTNEVLMQRAQHQSITGNVVLAELQTQGKGRRGRSWVSPFGRNLMMSFGMEIDAPISSVGTFSLAIGVAVAQAVEALGVDNVQLKWPNDVYIKGKKLGGILIDLLQPTRPAPLLVGIGINVGVAPTNIAANGVPAIALNQLVGNTSRNALVAVLLEELQIISKRYDEFGFKGLMDAWLARDALANQVVEVQGLRETIVGTNQGIDPSGALCIDTGRGIHRVVGGDVSLRRV